MRHRLVPGLILHHHAAGRTSGAFEAVCLFVDTSGFTPLTSAMMAHGIEGAEIVADTLTAVFSPLVRAVYATGGFIAAFAGDAFKAVFPLDQPDAHWRAATVAWEIRQRMGVRQHVETRFGAFELAVKVTMADGEVVWGVWERAEDRGTESQRAAYWFEGTALARCVEADPLAAAGEVVLTDAVYRRLIDQGAGLLAEPVADCWRLLALAAPGLADAAEQQRISVRDESGSADFYPPELLDMPVQGEFRRVVTVFINLPDMPADGGFADALFRLMAQYDGYLCRIGRIGERDRGATLLLFWGAPLSHENDLARALGFLLELRQAQPGVALRAGVTTGLAYAGYIGSEQREEYTCHGATVNLAARLMVTAPWGQVWLDEAAASLAQGQFEVEPAGRRHLKGFDAPRMLYRLAGRRETGEAAFFRGTMVGRHAELAQLRDALQPLAEGRFAGVVTVVGEAGLGKSRLAHELTAGGPWTVQLCPCDDIHRPSLHPFRHWLRNYFEQSGATGEAENTTRFERVMDALIAGTTRPELAVELGRTRSALGALLDLHWEGSLFEQLDPQGRFENTLLALKTLFMAESLRHPLIIHVEDAHWLDPDSRHFLARLVRNVSGYPFAVMLAGRPEFERLAVAPDVPQLDIVLEPLLAADLGQLAGDLLGKPAAPALVTLLVERAEGNPFFAEQILLYLQERGLLTAAPGGLAPAGGVDAVPLNARAVLVARIDRLAAEVRRVVLTAAVLGREFELQLLAAMLQDDPAVRQRVTKAEAAAVWTALSELRYLFRHALLRDAAYEMQLLATRRGLHRLAGEALEQLHADDLAPAYGELAYHFERAEVEGRARRYLEAAGDQASDRYQNGAALDFYERLLRRLRPGDPAAPVSIDSGDAALAAPVMLKHATVLRLVGRWAETERELLAVRELAERSDLPLLRAEAQSQLAVLYRRLGKLEIALLCAQDAVDTYLAYHATEGLDGALNQLGVILWRKGEPEAALACHREALQLAREKDDKHSIAASLSNMANVSLYRDELEQALEYLREALDLEQRYGRKNEIAMRLQNMAIVYHNLDDYPRAMSCYTESLALNREIGNRSAVARGLGNLATLHQLLGDHQETLRLLAEAIDIDLELGNRAGVAWHQGNLAWSYVQLGDLATALDLLTAALPVVQESGAKLMLASYTCMFAKACLLAGRRQEAAAASAEARRLALDAGYVELIFETDLLDARLAAQAGDPLDATQRLERLLQVETAPDRRAAALYELWRLDPAPERRLGAVEHYRALVTRSPNAENQSRLQELLAAG